MGKLKPFKFKHNSRFFNSLKKQLKRDECPVTYGELEYAKSHTLELKIERALAFRKQFQDDDMLDSLAGFECMNILKELVATKFNVSKEHVDIVDSIAIVNTGLVRYRIELQD